MENKKRFKIGAAAAYIGVEEVAQLLGVEVKKAKALCSFFKIPMLSFGGQSKHYVLVYALEKELFRAGLPVEERENPLLVSAHLELASVMYGTLTKEALKERVSLLAKTLTSTTKKAKIRRPGSSWSKWGGRKPSG